MENPLKECGPRSRWAVTRLQYGGGRAARLKVVTRWIPTMTHREKYLSKPQDNMVCVRDIFKLLKEVRGVELAFRVRAS
jgi:hypothetical protein